MAVLVTGGAGYIGSHTVVELLSSNEEVIIFDNFSNSKPESLKRIERITGKSFRFYEADLLEPASLEKIFSENKINSVIHFAGLKAVGESVAKPLTYYKNNVAGTLNLLEAVVKHKVRNFVFSSSATVYGAPKSVPIKEDFELHTTNPYGTSKLEIEYILRDVATACDWMSVVILRYFNPIGAHESGLIGEDPQGIPNNLLPYVAKVAIGKLDCLSVYGNDYNTVDGTGVRDYIHVVDLARAHLKALEYAAKTRGVDYFNVGTGKGYSVLEIISAYEKAVGHPIKYIITGRRPGDIDECYADPRKAMDMLGFKAQFGIDRMCEDIVRWQSQNPDGYGN